MLFMIREIDINRYKLHKSIDDDGQEVYFDKAKGKYRIVTPEETVRQSFVEFLHDKLRIPFEAMLTEENLSHHISGDTRSMDICVERDTFDGRKIVMVVECKEPDVMLTDDVYLQAKGYAETLDIPVIMVTNGYQLDCIMRLKDNSYVDVVELPSYADLENYGDIKTAPIEEYSYTRWSYSELFDESVHFIEKCIGNHVARDTSADLIPSVLNIAECFLDTSHKINDLPLKNYEFVSDDGVYNKKAGNPVCDFVSNYRLVKIKGNDDKVKSIAFAVVLDGHPALFVGTFYHGKFHNALELHLERYMEVNNNQIYISHDYRGQHKKEDFKEYVDNKNIFTKDGDDNIILARNLDNSKLLYCDDYDIQEFMANLIEYAILRDEYKEILGKK